MARWASSLAAAGVVLFVIGPLLAHVGTLPALGGFLVFGIGGLFGLIAFVLGLIAAARGAGTGRGLVIGAAVSAVFVAMALPGRGVPRINDITTDTSNPPQFVTATTLPANHGRDMAYPGATFAEQQHAGYPDLGPLRMTVPPDEAFKRVEAAVRGMPDFEISRVDPATHALEGIATTRLFRFHDDFVIEVRPDGTGSLVEMRSKSRDGKGDVGANAARIRAVFAKLS